jgi:hypothetical protein
MNHRWIRILAAGALGVGLLAGQTAARSKVRQEAQDARMKAGRRDGSLTKKEAAKLEARDKALDAKIRHDRKDGGGLTAVEKRRIEKLQDKQSKAIYRERHDAQTKK